MEFLWSLLYSEVTHDMWTKLSFEATWAQEGGSGSRYSREDLLGMTMDELVSHVVMVQDRRKAESDAIRKSLPTSKKHT